MPMSESAGLSINYTSLKNLRPYDQNKNALTYLAILIAGFMALSLVVYGVSQIAPSFTRIGVATLVAWPIFIMILGMLSEDRILKTNRKCLEDFVTDNDFNQDLLPSDSLEYKPGSFFHIPGHRAILDVIHGTINGTNFNLYTCFYDNGARKAIPHEMVILEIALPASYPHMVIDSLVEVGKYGIGLGPSTLPIKFDQKQRINLEGDFSDYFALYAGDKQAVSALTILAPDVMATLKEYAAHCDLEIIKDRLYFYWSKSPKQLKDYKRILDTVEYVWPQINYELKRLQRITTDDGATISADTRLITRQLSQKQKRNRLILGYILMQLVVFSWSSLTSQIPLVDKLTKYLPWLIISSMIYYIGARLIRRKNLLDKLTDRSPN